MARMEDDIMKQSELAPPQKPVVPPQARVRPQDGTTQQYGGTTVRRTEGANGPTFTGAGRSEPRGMRSITENVQPAREPATYGDNPMQRRMLDQYEQRQRRLRESRELPLQPSEWRYRTDMRNARVGTADPNGSNMTAAARRAAIAAREQAIAPVQERYQQRLKAYNDAKGAMSTRLGTLEDNDATRQAALEKTQLDNFNQRRIRELQEAGLGDRLTQDIGYREGRDALDYDLRSRDIDSRNALLEKQLEVSDRAIREKDDAKTREKINTVTDYIAAGDPGLKRYLEVQFAKNPDLIKEYEADPEGFMAKTVDVAVGQQPGETVGPEIMNRWNPLTYLMPGLALGEAAANWIPGVGVDQVRPGEIGELQDARVNRGLRGALTSAFTNVGYGDIIGKDARGRDIRISKDATNRTLYNEILKRYGL